MFNFFLILYKVLSFSGRILLHFCISKMVFGHHLFPKDGNVYLQGRLVYEQGVTMIRKVEIYCEGKMNINVCSSYLYKTSLLHSSKHCSKQLMSGFLTVASKSYRFP